MENETNNKLMKHGEKRKIKVNSMCTTFPILLYKVLCEGISKVPTVLYYYKHHFCFNITISSLLFAILMNAVCVWLNQMVKPVIKTGIYNYCEKYNKQKVRVTFAENFWSFNKVRSVQAHDHVKNN